MRALFLRGFFYISCSVQLLLNRSHRYMYKKQSTIIMNPEEIKHFKAIGCNIILEDESTESLSENTTTEPLDQTDDMDATPVLVSIYQSLIMTHLRALRCKGKYAVPVLRTKILSPRLAACL